MTRPTPRRLAARWCLLIVALCLLPYQDAVGYQSERVVLVIIDGLRYTEGLGDPAHAYVPEMWALAQEGATVETFRNDGYTYTSRAIPAIWCGAWTEINTFPDPDCGGQENNYAVMPTIFEYFRLQLDRAQEDCVYVLKDVGCPWKASFDQDYGPDYWPLYHGEGYTDPQVWNEAQDILVSLSPSFCMLYLAEVDHAGHSGNWDYYINAIRTADGIVGELWEYLQTDPDYAGRTTMIVTNDHGRHTDDWTGHGCSCSGCRSIQLLAVGPDICRGLLSTLPRTLRDVTPTVGALLGFDAERATGVIMEELLLPDSSDGEEPVDDLIPPLAIIPRTNPCLGGTELSLRLPAPGPIRLTVHAVDGSLEAVLYDGTPPFDSFRFAWNASDARRRNLAAGVYYLHLETAGAICTQRIVIVR